MQSKNIIGVAAAAVPPAIALACYYAIYRDQALARRAVDTFSAPARELLGRASAHVSFSVMEWLYVLLAAAVVIYIVTTVLAIVKSDRKAAALFRRVLILAVAVLYLLGGYLWLWGIDYRTPSFAARTGLDDGPVATEELYTVTAYFIRNALVLANAVDRDADGRFVMLPDEYLPRAPAIYGALQEEFPVLAGTCRVPKQMLFSRVMSRMGFTGIFFPFTGESNLNVDCPGAFIPATAAHELAHQLGVTSEQECNFLGIAACLSSEDAVYVYSGFLMGSTYLMNALYDADRDLWQALRDTIRGPMLVDWNDNNKYWWRFESPVTEVSAAVYDTYLKANGQDLGMRSYGACVDLLVHYYYR